MHDDTTSRRSVLKAGAAVASLATVGSLSGCSSIPFVGGGGGSANADQRIDKVPAGSTFVLHVSVSAMLTDSTVQERVNGLIDEQATQSTGPQNITAALDQVEAESGLDPRDVTEMLAFGDAEGSTAGTILWTEWEESAVTSAMSDTEYSEESYGDKTVYVPSSSFGGGTWAALLEEGTYAFGTEQSVKSIIDTWTGSADAASGDVETAYTSAQGGYVQFGFAVPEQQLPEGGSGGSGGMNAQALNNLQYGYGSVTDGDNGREMVVNLEAENNDAASGIKGIIDIGLGSFEQQLQQTAQAPGADTESLQEFQTALENVETSVDGSTVTITNSDGITFALGALAVAFTFALGFGGTAVGGTSVTSP
ncbi:MULTISPECIES: hypothetical protein [Salinibaculum]|uniref:hypothetical protein n=1 Tax=Salinibaculum TaxID=2732368 RepID=UPI0030CB2646